MEPSLHKRFRFVRPVKPSSRRHSNKDMISRRKRTGRIIQRPLARTCAHRHSHTLEDCRDCGVIGLETFQYCLNQQRSHCPWTLPETALTGMMSVLPCTATGVATRVHSFIALLVVVYGSKERQRPASASDAVRGLRRVVAGMPVSYRAGSASDDGFSL